MHRKTIDVWVGLFVLLGVASLLFLALQAGNMSTISFSKTYAVTGKFDNIGGLKPQAAVKSAGVVVGRVDSIVVDDKSFQARVTLALENLIGQFLYNKAADGPSPAPAAAPAKK